MPVFISSLSNVKGSGSLGSNGLVLRTVRFSASISIIIPVLEPEASFILPLPASWLNSALKRVAGSGSGLSPVWFVGLQVARRRPEGIVMLRIPSSLEIVQSGYKFECGGFTI